MSEVNHGTVETALDYIDNFEKVNIRDVVISQSTAQKRKSKIRQQENNQKVKEQKKESKSVVQLVAIRSNQSQKLKGFIKDKFQLHRDINSYNFERPSHKQEDSDEGGWDSGQALMQRGESLLDATSNLPILKLGTYNSIVNSDQRNKGVINEFSPESRQKSSSLYNNLAAVPKTLGNNRLESSYYDFNATTSNQKNERRFSINEMSSKDKQRIPQIDQRSQSSLGIYEPKSALMRGLEQRNESLPSLKKSQLELSQALNKDGSLTTLLSTAYAAQNKSLIKLSPIKKTVSVYKQTVTLKQNSLELEMVFDENKVAFIEAMELLVQASMMCFLSAYERGTIECLNMVIRSCSNVQDMYILKPVYRLLSQCYIQFREWDQGIQCLERFRDITEDQNEFTTMIEIYQMMAYCYSSQKEFQRALLCYQTMLQYAWYVKNVEAETQCYALLSLQYYNLSDIQNCRYYQDRQMKQQLEPDDSRTKELALREINQKMEARELDRLIGCNKHQGIDMKGSVYERSHRTLTTYDSNDNPVVVDICNYKNAWALRKLTEEYIATKLSHDLDIFEYIQTERERQQADQQILKMLNKSSKKSLAPPVSFEDNSRFLRIQENFSFLFQTIPPSFFQKENLTCQLNLKTGNDVTAEDWDWGEKFHVAGYMSNRQDFQQQNRIFQIRAGTAQICKDASSVPFLARKSIKPTRLNAQGDEEFYIDEDAKKQQDDAKRFARKLCQDRVGVDYLDKILEEKRQNLKRMKALEKLQDDTQDILVIKGSYSGKMLELVCMNHTAPQKLKRTLKKQKEIGFEKTRREFTRLQKEIAHEKNYCFFKTSWEAKGRKGQTLKYYCYQPIEPGFRASQKVQESELYAQEQDIETFQVVNLKNISHYETASISDKFIESEL